MNNPVQEQGSHAQQDPKSFLKSLPFLGNIIKWLASLIQWRRRRARGIYLDRLGGE